MSAKTSQVLRYGKFNTVAATGEFYGYGDEPDIWGHVTRRGLFRWEWEITAGPTGEPLAWGITWTRGGANVEAIAAAHRPGVDKAVAR
jgi:hypothetical protein